MPDIHIIPLENPDWTIMIAAKESRYTLAPMCVFNMLRTSDHAGSKSINPKCAPSNSEYVLDVLVILVVDDRHLKSTFVPNIPCNRMTYPTTDVYS